MILFPGLVIEAVGLTANKDKCSRAAERCRDAIEDSKVWPHRLGPACRRPPRRLAPRLHRCPQEAEYVHRKALRTFIDLVLANVTRVFAQTGCSAPAVTEPAVRVMLISRKSPCLVHALCCSQVAEPPAFGLVRLVGGEG